MGCCYFVCIKAHKMKDLEIIAQKKSLMQYGEKLWQLNFFCKLFSPILFILLKSIYLFHSNNDLGSYAMSLMVYQELFFSIKEGSAKKG